MSFRERALKTDQKAPSFRDRAKKINPKHSEFEKTAVTAASELFGGAVGALPSLAHQASELQPGMEHLEEEARTGFLPPIGSESAPEKGLANLFALVGKIPGIEKFTIEELRKRFQESTENQFNPESTLGKGIARGASLVGQAIPFGAGGLSNLTRIATGGVAGQALREKGAPEWLATGAEIGTPAFAASLGKKIPLSSKDQELATLSKKIGMSDNQIAAMLKSPKSQNTFAKFASKGEKAQNLVSSLFDNLGDQYANLKTSGRSSPKITGKPLDNLIKKWKNVLHDLKQTHIASPDKAASIEYVEKAINDLVKNGTNPEKLINSYQDVNKTVNWNSFSGGKKHLSALQTPIKETLIEAAPEIGREFVLTNDLYKKSINLAKILKPSDLENLLAHGHAGELALGLATFNPGILNKYLGFLGSRALSREALFSPRFNKMSTKLLSAIKKNDKTTINRLLQDFQKDIIARFPEESEGFEIPEYS